MILLVWVFERRGNYLFDQLCFLISWVLEPNDKYFVSLGNLLVCRGYWTQKGRSGIVHFDNNICRVLGEAVGVYPDCHGVKYSFLRYKSSVVILCRYFKAVFKAGLREDDSLSGKCLYCRRLCWCGRSWSGYDCFIKIFDDVGSVCRLIHEWSWLYRGGAGITICDAYAGAWGSGRSGKDGIFRRQTCTYMTDADLCLFGEASIFIGLAVMCTYRAVEVFVTFFVWSDIAIILVDWRLSSVDRKCSKSDHTQYDEWKSGDKCKHNRSFWALLFGGKSVFFERLVSLYCLLFFLIRIGRDIGGIVCLRCGLFRLFLGGHNTRY